MIKNVNLDQQADAEVLAQRIADFGEKIASLHDFSKKVWKSDKLPEWERREWRGMAFAFEYVLDELGIDYEPVKRF